VTPAFLYVLTSENPLSTHFVKRQEEQGPELLPAPALDGGIVSVGWGVLCRPLGSRLEASDAPMTTVAPHQHGHDERPHTQEQDAHQLDDRWDEAFVGPTTAPSYMNAAPETIAINPTQRG